MWSKRGKSDPYAMSGDEAFTFLGRGAHFKGIINFEGTIRIDGRLEGEIHTKGTLVVGEHAVIEGEVSAGTVISGGRITGNIVASKNVQLISTGIMIGTIKTPLLSIEEGVRFSGTCDAEGRGEVRSLEEAREVAQPEAARNELKGDDRSRSSARTA